MNTLYNTPVLISVLISRISVPLVSVVWCFAKTSMSTPQPRTRTEERGVLSHTRSQGDAFIPICHEVGGRQGAQANHLLGKIC